MTQIARKNETASALGYNAIMPAGGPTVRPSLVAAHATPGTVAAALVRIALIAGSLDIGENLIFNAFRHITPAMVFRYIAAGAVGPRAAVQWGGAAVALGVVFHYSIALIWTAVFFAASRWLRFLLRRPLLWGPLYGLVVYLFMTYVVLPLSRLPPHGPPSPASRISLILASLFCIGFAIAFLTGRDPDAATWTRPER